MIMLGGPDACLRDSCRRVASFWGWPEQSWAFLRDQCRRSGALPLPPILGCMSLRHPCRRFGSCACFGLLGRA
eukprot:4568268-Karenia_brevis.AAC.1